MEQKWARPWFATTFGLVVVELIITVVLAADKSGGHFHSAGARVFNVFWYFTIESNVIVGITCLLLAVNPNRASTVFAVFRLIGVVAITVTFVVFHVALSHLLDLNTWEQTANHLQHTVVPIVAVIGWFAFGPRRLTSPRIARFTVLFPILYMIGTAIRGPLVRDWYPYPFADVQAHGYLRVTINGIWIALLFYALAVGAAALDKRLPDR